MNYFKRATNELRELGIDNLIVKKGLWGYYLYDPTAKDCRQTTVCYKTAKEAILSAKSGTRPTIKEVGR